MSQENMSIEESKNVIKNGSFGGKNGIVILLEKEILERQGLLEAYQTLYPNSFWPNSYGEKQEVLTLEQAKYVGII